MRVCGLGPAASLAAPLVKVRRSLLPAAKPHFFPVSDDLPTDFGEAEGGMKSRGRWVGWIDIVFAGDPGNLVLLCVSEHTAIQQATKTHAARRAGNDDPIDVQKARITL
jgi:hypothetical protein